MRSAVKTGVVMMNLGGPATQAAVEPFLTRLFSDREIISLPFQEYSSRLIARRRSGMVREQYQKIGGGSPIRRWTETQGALLESLLDSVSPATAPHKSYVCFRYADPLTADCVAAIKADAPSRLIAFSQYPQYSCTTTGSSLNELHRELKRQQVESAFDWTVIDSWATHPSFLSSIVTNIENALETKLPAGVNKSDVALLFSAHSVPQRVADRGDRYPGEVAASVLRVMEMLPRRHPYHLAWQSKVGPLPWLSPKVSDAIKALGRRGRKHVLVVPIAFTSDHIETLYELDMTYKDLAQEVGISTFIRTESLNAQPHFIKTMAQIVCDHIAAVDRSRSAAAATAGGSGSGGGDAAGKENWVKTGPQLEMRCVSCVNPYCAESKTFWCGKTVSPK